MARVRDLDVLILGALRPRRLIRLTSHSVSIGSGEGVAPRATFFTHLTHDVSHRVVRRTCPTGVRLRTTDW